MEVIVGLLFSVLAGLVGYFVLSTLGSRKSPAKHPLSRQSEELLERIRFEASERQRALELAVYDWTTPDGPSIGGLPPRTELSNPGRISATFASAEFSDGVSLSFEANDIIVFVGPNNSGKSASLQGLQQLARSGSERGPVVAKASLRLQGTLQELADWLGQSTRVEVDRGGGVQFSRMGSTIRLNDLTHVWSETEQNGLGSLCDFLVHRLTTESRLLASRPAPRVALLREPISHPAQMLEANDQLEAQLSQYFRAAFGVDLFLHRGGGKELPLLCGVAPPLGPGQDRVSAPYLREMDKLPQVHQQGDGMRSFAGVLLNAFLLPYSCLLVDEPEAFLHPPQARIMGRMLADESALRAQMFVATHSGDFVRGLLDGRNQRVRIVRLTRDQGGTSTRELQNADMMQLWNDPLLRHSNILDGLFHERVVVCESDSDSRFYDAMTQTICGGGSIGSDDIMFTNAGGKDRIPTVVRALAKLGVPIIAIVDFDALRDRRPFRALVESFGIDWAEVESDWLLVVKNVEGGKPDLVSDEVKTQISSVLDKVTTSRFPDAAAREIERILGKTSAWSRIKNAGLSLIGSGEPAAAARRLLETLSGRGIFVVALGELERFCPSIGVHGPAWVNAVLEKDLATDPELQAARDFAKAIVTWRHR